MMSRFFPDPSGPVNEHPGPDFARSPALQARTRDLEAATDNQLEAASQDTAQTGEASTQYELDRAAARAFLLRAPHQEAEAS